jgi:hypothetical protein
LQKPRIPIWAGGFWPRKETPSLFDAWHIYRLHVHTYHQDYERWKSRMSWYYVIPLVLFFAVPILAAQITPRYNFQFISVVSFVAALALVGVVLVIKQRGKKRFQYLWNQEHGRPHVSP